MPVVGISQGQSQNLADLLPLEIWNGADQKQVGRNNCRRKHHPADTKLQAKVGLSAVLRAGGLLKFGTQNVHVNNFTYF